MHIGSAVFTVVTSRKMSNSDTEVTMKPHNHSFYEIRLFQGSDAISLVGEQEILLKDGAVLITPPKVYHAMLPLSDSSFYYHALRFYPSGDGEPGPDEKLILSRIASPTVVYDSDKWIDKLFKRIDVEFERHIEGFPERIRLLSCSIVDDIMEKLFPDGGLHWAENYTSFDRQRENIIESYMNLQFFRDISINELADKLHLSSRQVNRIIQEQYGHSFSDGVRKVRMEYAKLYLKYTDCSVGYIAQRCGFNSLNYFYTVFRSEMSMSPGEYRRQKAIQAEGAPHIWHAREALDRCTDPDCAMRTRA